MNELALFAGAGGGILGGKILGWRTVCAVEIDPYCRDILMARQNDGTLAPFPVWDDVRTFRGQDWRGIVDVVSGGFPCQDISCAGKGAGIDGSRSGLWGEMARIVGEIRPRYVYVENSPMLVRRGLARVLGDLAKMGHAARWGIVGAHHAGAPHKRDRLWILGDSHSKGKSVGTIDAEASGMPDVANPNGTNALGEADAGLATVARKTGHGMEKGRHASLAYSHGAGLPHGGHSRRQAVETPPSAEARTKPERCSFPWWLIEPSVGRVADGVPNRTHRLKQLGNAVVPQVVEVIGHIIMQIENRGVSHET